MLYFNKAKYLLILLCLVFVGNIAFAKMDVVTIDAERNANRHNNLGVVYMQDRYYAPAIKEFQMAVLLNPNSQATAVYYANLANCYMKIGYPALAQDTLQRAIKLNPMNFSYYEDLAVVYKRLNIIPQQLKHYQKETMKNPLSIILIGLMLIEQGNEQQGIARLHEFVDTEPDLIITSAVRSYILQKESEQF